MQKQTQYTIFEPSRSRSANGVFTLADTDTDKEWVIKNCVEVFILPDRDTDTDTDTDAIGLQTHFVGVGISVGVGQCEHTIKPPGPAFLRDFIGFF